MNNYSNPPPPFEIAPPPPPGGEPSPWPRKHSKYQAPKAPEHLYKAPKVQKLISTVIPWYRFVVRPVYLGPARQKGRFQGGRGVPGSTKRYTHSALKPPPPRPAPGTLAWQPFPMGQYGPVARRLGEDEGGHGIPLKSNCAKGHAPVQPSRLPCYSHEKFSLDEFLAWAEAQDSFVAWTKRAFDSDAEKKECLTTVKEKYFGGDMYKESDWGETFVRETFRSGTQIRERGMLQYIQYLSDDAILDRIGSKHKPLDSENVVTSDTRSSDSF